MSSEGAECATCLQLALYPAPGHGAEQEAAHQQASRLPGSHWRQPMGAPGGGVGGIRESRKERRVFISLAPSVKSPQAGSVPSEKITVF